MDKSVHKLLVGGVSRSTLTSYAVGKRCHWFVLYTTLPQPLASEQRFFYCTCIIIIHSLDLVSSLFLFSSNPFVRGIEIHII